MPRVPTYQTQQEAPRALPGARQDSIASPALFGAAAEDQMRAGKSLLDAGTALNQAAVRIQERENADRIFRAETGLKDDYLKFEASVRERKGQNAWGVTTETEKWFAEQEKKHSEVLTNDVQRTLFNRAVTRLRQSSLGTISAYESGERRRSLEESAKASIVGSINLAAGMAAEGVTDIPSGANQGEAVVTKDADGNEVVTAPGVTIGGGGRLAGIKGDIIKRVQVLAQLNGWAPERRDAEQASYLTNFHKQVIQGMAVKNPSGAKEYYEANKEEINGADRDGVERALKEGTLREVSQTATDEIVAKGLPLDQALAEVRGKYKGDEEDEIARRVKERYGEAEAIKQRDQRAAADDAWKVVTAGGGRRQIPLEVWNRLGGEEQRQVNDYLDAKYRRAQAEAKKDDSAGKDDLNNLSQVEQMIEQGTITDKAQLARYEPFFSKSTLRTLGNKIDKRGQVSPTEIRRVFEDRKGAKVNVAKMGEQERAEWMAFQDYILANVRETKRPEDVDVWADRWFAKGYGKDDSLFTNDPDTFGEARTKGRKDFVIATPDAAKPLVNDSLAVLKRAGVAVPAGKTATDEFYTKHYLDAERWLAAHSIPSSPSLVAAYTMLRQSKKPITPANLDYVAKQLK